MKRTILFTLSALLVATAAGAQSLAEVAKKEEARRKEIKTPSKVYTNEDLKRYAPTTPAAQTSIPAPTPAAGTPGTAPAGQDPSAQPPGAEKEPVKDEAWWRNRITEARTSVERNTLLLDSLQTRANALVNDFTARDDPAQRAVLAQERAKTLAELQRVQDEITAAKKAIVDIEEEARRAGVPPGWLR